MVDVKRDAQVRLSCLALAVAWPVVVGARELGGPPAVPRLLPEPATLLLIGLALLCVVIVARRAQRRRRRKDPAVIPGKPH